MLEAVAARHPVIEQWMEETREGRFIANDLYLNADDSGPSLLLDHRPEHGRQKHLSAPGRHAGADGADGQLCSGGEPAASGLVDRIYTRIGASDNVARGRSTFMVEMTETATILNTATRRSLILLDEMGRGTATFDGLSLAWATVEYLHAETGARTLFATHYHELTMLAEKLPRVRNLRVGVKEGAGGIVFLHNIEPGAASKSYGIEVAQLAGLPAAVIERAKHVLRQHEKQERQSVQVETAAGADAVDHLHSALAAHRRPHRSHGRECADAAAGAESARRAAAGTEGKRHDDDEVCGRPREPAGRRAGRDGADGARARVAQAGAPGRRSFFSGATSRTRSRRARCSMRPPAFCCPTAVRCVDVEGGTVNRLRDALAPMPSAQAVAAAMRVPPFPKNAKETSSGSALAGEHGELIARAVKAFGFNTTLAPVVDLALPEAVEVLGSRTAGANAAEVIAYARDFLAGLAAHGVVGCGKHFPGLGGATGDTHFVTPEIQRTWQQMWDEDLVPYRELHRAMPMVMMNHAAYPRHAGQERACQRLAILDHGVLRKRIGYKGIILSDDLEMGGILKFLPVEEAAVAAIRAGSDLLEICHSAELILRSYEAWSPRPSARQLFAKC